MYNLLLCRKCCVNDGLSAIHDLDRCKFERIAAKIYSFVLWLNYGTSTCCQLIFLIQFASYLSFLCCVNCDNNEQSYECFDTWRKNIKYKIKYTGQGLCACKLVLITYVQSHCKGIFILR